MLTADRHTPYREGDIVHVPVAADVEIFNGALTVANADGYAAPGSEAANLTYLGRADAHVDNTGGGDGDVMVPVRRLKAFYWRNASGDPVTQDMLGQRAYILDDETVAGTDNSGARSEAGVVVAIDDGGVWIQ